MIHIYEIDDGATIYHEVYKTVIGAGWGEEFQIALENKYEFDLYLDILHAQGLDYVIHTLGEYDEHHVSLPPVQAS
ncbi:MAG: hypothetical protein NTW48_02455 [Chloroflexi bacterium]|nr:hypothetical protein [Chloroflexota bacterium]